MLKCELTRPGLVMLFITLVYWSQFSSDFIIYAASNKQYRDAYLLLLSEAYSACKRRIGCQSEVENSNHMPLAIINGSRQS